MEDNKEKMNSEEIAEELFPEENADEQPAAEETAEEETADAKLAEVQAQADDFKDRWMRSMAEFDNYRKRTTKEKEQSFDRGVRDVVEKLLPVIDNFERAIAGGDSSDAYAAGVEMIYKQLKSVLADMGVEEIEALGKPFDPVYHYAVQHIENPELGEGVVANVFQKGYKHKDAVIRCSMVIVAN